MKKFLLINVFTLCFIIFVNAQQSGHSNVQPEKERQDKQHQLEKSKQKTGASVSLEQLKNSTGVVHIHQRRLDAMTEEDKKYILEHPEKFIIVK